MEVQRASFGLRETPVDAAAVRAAIAAAVQEVAVEDLPALLRYGAQDVPRLLQLLEPQHTSEAAAEIEQLLQSAIAAVAERNTPKALQDLSRLLVLDPSRAETIDTDPRLAAIRPDIEQLLAKLTRTAKITAESRLAEAEQVQRDPEKLLQLAGALIEAGGYVNYERSARLSQLVMEGANWAPVPAPAPLPTLLPRAAKRIRLSRDDITWICLAVVVIVGVFWIVLKS